MIYILEGIHGAGKTYYAENVLKMETKKLRLKRLPLIKQALKEDNVVFDRLFGLAYIDAPRYEIEKLNDYLKTRKDIKCYMFICDREISWKREQEKHPNAITREEHDRVYDGMERLYNLMDVFELIDTTE